MRVMGRGFTTTATFLFTTALMLAFLFGFDLVADSVPRPFWVITLLFIVPVWPITLAIEVVFDPPLEVMHPIQNVMASVVWGIAASGIAFYFSTSRKVLHAGNTAPQPAHCIIAGNAPFYARPTAQMDRTASLSNWRDRRGSLRDPQPPMASRPSHARQGKI